MEKNSRKVHHDIIVDPPVLDPQIEEVKKYRVGEGESEIMV